MTIDAYHFGRITIDGEEFTKDLIILPNKIIHNWWREEGHRLRIKDLGPALPDLFESEHLLFGTGAHGQMIVSEELLGELRAYFKSVEALPTAEAVIHYNVLPPETTAMALHLTC